MEKAASHNVPIAAEPDVHCVLEPSTGRWMYIAACTATKMAVIIDPVLDKRGRGNGLSATGADNLLKIVLHYGYEVKRIVETHIHDEHPSAAWYLRTQLRIAGQDPRISIGKSAAGFRRLMERKYAMQDPGFTGAFDGEYNDGDCFQIGQMKVLCMKLPGHSPEQVGFLVGGNVFVGGALPNIDSAVPVSPLARGLQGDEDFIASARRILTLPREYRIYKGHDQIVARPATSARESGQTPLLVAYATVGEHLAYYNLGGQSTPSSVSRPTTPSGAGQTQQRSRAFTFKRRGAAKMSTGEYTTLVS